MTAWAFVLLQLAIGRRQKKIVTLIESVEWHLSLVVQICCSAGAWLASQQCWTNAGLDVCESRYCQNYCGTNLSLIIALSATMYMLFQQDQRVSLQMCACSSYNYGWKS